MNRCSFAFLIAGLSCAPAAACDGCELVGSEGAKQGQGAGASGDKAGQGDEELVVDGYKVISAGPVEKRSAAPPDKDREHLVMEPTSPDPHGGEFTLEEAVQGLGTDGTLVAEIDTDLGTLFCDLHAEKAPKTVANFIGLTRGKRQWWNAKAGTWIAQRYYDALTFHRVVPDYMIQGGDYLGDGTGTVGYALPPENEGALHDEPGLLCMASAEHAAQFFITDGPATQLDGGEEHYTVFGKCLQEDIVHRIARVPQSGRPDYRPLTPVKIERVFVKRVRGGAAKAKRTPPKPAPTSAGSARGASPGPAELAQ